MKLIEYFFLYGCSPFEELLFKNTFHKNWLVTTEA